MNNQRRKDLDRAIDLLREAQAIVDQARDEEQEYVDNMPDNMRYGEKGETAQGNVECLQDAYDAIDEIVDTHIAGATGNG